MSAAASSSSSSSSKKRKAEDGNAAFFATEPASVRDALKRVLAGSTGLEAAAGVMSIEDSSDAAACSAPTLAEKIKAEQKKVEALPRREKDALTENGDAAYSTSQSGRIDLFFHLVRGADGSLLQSHCARAWQESPEQLVQLLLHARDARGGKGERLATWEALLWLRSNKPATYLHNLAQFTSVGYFKDLLQIAKLVEDRDLAPMGLTKRKVNKRPAKKAKKSANEQVNLEPDETLELELLAEFLRADYERLQQPKQVQPAEGGEAASASSSSSKGKKAPHVSLSLAAKWAPSEGSSFDKSHDMAHRLARLVFPSEPLALRRYRSMLSECRDHINIVESKMCAQQYDAIQFESLPAKAHQLLRKAFQKHCGERYAEYLKKLSEGKATIKSAGLMPHELVSPYLVHDPKKDETIEGAWKAIMEGLKKQAAQTKGGFNGALAVVDVSGSMSCNNAIPMKCAISLGLIISELCDGPFGGRCITFHESPSWFKIPQNKSLCEQVKAMQRMDWGGSTNLRAVFDLILNMAVEAKVKAKDMPKKLFIFSDMQFNSAFRDGDRPQSTFEYIKKKYEARGYPMPQIIFWNLSSNCKGFPVDLKTPGVALISGYSAQLMKAFLDGTDIDPMSIMISSIGKYEVVIEESER